MRHTPCPDRLEWCEPGDHRCADPGAKFRAWRRSGRAFLEAYNAELCAPVSALILRNRGAGPFGLLNMVNDRCGGEFDDIEEVIPEGRAVRSSWANTRPRAAGFARDTLERRACDDSGRSPGEDLSKAGKSIHRGRAVLARERATRVLIPTFIMQGPRKHNEKNTCPCFNSCSLPEHRLLNSSSFPVRRVCRSVGTLMNWSIGNLSRWGSGRNPYRCQDQLLPPRCVRI